MQGRGIKVDGKTITQFDYALKPGMKVSVSKTKKNQEVFKSRYIKIVYEDRYIIVVEKNVGILSMAAGHSTLNVKTVLDDYFHKTRQNCQAHVVHRLDRDTSGLMIYAKDKQTELALEDDWHHNVYDRRYVALVSGEMEEDEGTVANWLKDNKAYITYASDTDMAASTPLPISIPCSAPPSILWWNISWRRVERTRFVCILPIWDTRFVVTLSMVMAMIHAVVFACMLMCFASTIR